MKENINCIMTDDVSFMRLLIWITAHFAFCIKFIYKIILICFYCSTRWSETPSKYIIKRWLCKSERSTNYGFVNEVYAYFFRLYFALLIWLSCNYHRKIKSQPETSLHALVFMSRGQETLASGSVRWHEQAYEFSQSVWSFLLYLSVDWLVKSHIFIPASQMLQFNSTYQPRIIFRCCWRLIQFLSKCLNQKCSG